MNEVLNRFQGAVTRMRAPAVRKLLVPGVHKFFVRYWARLTRGALTRRAGPFFGDSMRVVLPEVISETLYTYGLFDDVVTDMVIRHVN